MIAGGPNQVSSKIVAVEGANGLARVQFSSLRVELALPLGWQATEDWERGVAYSSDKRYRVLVWRVDFAYEGVKDAEHYAATKAGSIQVRRPTVQAQARKLGDGTFLIVYDNVKAPGDPAEFGGSPAKAGIDRTRLGRDAGASRRRLPDLGRSGDRGLPVAPEADPRRDDQRRGEGMRVGQSPCVTKDSTP